MAFYFYLSTKIIMVFITKSYQDLFGVRSYINAEYLQLMQQLAGRASYLTYLQKGGLSELYNLPTVESEKQYVASVKDMILLRDISPFVI